MQRIFFLGILLTITACRPADAASTAASVASQEPPLSTPVPARPTHTETPAFTSTPAPLYFRDEFNTSLQAWVSFQTGGEAAPDVRLENDRLRIDLSTPDTWYSMIHTAHEYETVFIRAKVYANAPGSVGLICMYGEDGWLEYNITTNGTYTLLYGRMLGDGIAQYTPVENKSSEYLQPKRLDYEAGLACDGAFAYLYVNEKLFRKIDVSRFQLSSGKIGLTFASYDEAPMIAAVDWFEVSRP